MFSEQFSELKCDPCDGVQACYAASHIVTTLCITAVLWLQVGRRAVDGEFNVPEAASTTYM